MCLIQLVFLLQVGVEVSLEGAENAPEELQIVSFQILAPLSRYPSATFLIVMKANFN